MEREKFIINPGNNDAILSNKSGFPIVVLFKFHSTIAVNVFRLEAILQKVQNNEILKLLKYFVFEN